MCIDLPLHQPCFESTDINEISFKIYVYAVKFLKQKKKRQVIKIKEFNLKKISINRILENELFAFLVWRFEIIFDHVILL